MAFLWGCAQPAATPTPTVLVPNTTPQVTQLTATDNVTSEPQAIKAENKCGEDGMLERYQIDSVLLNEPLFFSVYFPPCYHARDADEYPVLYALHGQNFNDAMWAELGLIETADELIRSEQVDPFLVVMPYEEHYFRGADVNNFPSALKDEIIPWVEQSLKVCAEKSCRAIGGISRGASWAMRIGLEEWDFYGAIGAHSLPTFRGDISNLPQWLEEIPSGEEPRIYMDTGRFDPEVKNAFRFEQILNEKGIPHEWHLNEGRHNEVYWKTYLESYLRWYSETWK